MMWAPHKKHRISKEIRCFSNFLGKFLGCEITVVLVAVLSHPLCNVNECEKPTFLGKLAFLFYTKSSNFSKNLAEFTAPFHCNMWIIKFKEPSAIVHCKDGY